jgi:hypothetical protein
VVTTPLPVMPNRWRSTRGRLALGADEGRSTEQAEHSRCDLQKPSHADITANPVVPSQDGGKYRSRRSFSRTRTDVDRPSTAGGVMAPTTNTEAGLPPRTTSRAYIAEAQRRPVQRMDLEATHSMEEDMIGMALGSPSHPPFVQFDVHDQLPPPGMDAEGHAHPEGMVGAKSTNAKAGKWKKFGGLFKPKHNPTTQNTANTSQPSQPEWDIDATESKPLPLPKDTPLLDQTLELPIAASMDSAETEDVEYDFPPLPHIELPKLEVNIPDVHMDRYSVMFSNLLERRQSSNLLSRRSKVLEKLKTTSDENVMSEEPLPEQHQPHNPGLPVDMATSEDHEQLKPAPSSRRATSPTPGKSPAFSLFPQPPTTPRRAAAMTPQPKPSPLQRSFTVPSHLSPMEETFGTKKPQAVKPNHAKRRKSSISLVETSASTTQGPGWSTDGSYLSPTSSVSSVGDEILFDIKKLSMVTENQEPQYEVTKPDGETVELYRALSQKIRAAKPPALKLSSKLAKAEGAISLAPQANDATWSTSDTAARSTDEASKEAPAPSKSLNPEYILPSTHFVPPTRVIKATEERSTPQPTQIIPQPSIPPTQIKEELIPPPSRPMAPVSDLPAEVEESAGASHDILAAAVMGTLDYMGEQSSVRAASPMPELPEERASTPVEKPIKLLVIPKNIPISKYSMRSPTTSHFKADLRTRSPSPQPRRAVTEPLMHNESIALAPKLQAAPGLPSSRVKTNTNKPNSSSKVSPAQGECNRKTRGPRPELIIVAPKPSAAIDSPVGASSPVEVTVARQVSLSRKQSKKLLIPPSGRKLGALGRDDGEKVVATQALMPVIVDANKAHRPGKSLALVIENA